MVTVTTKAHPVDAPDDLENRQFTPVGDQAAPAEDTTIAEPAESPAMTNAEIIMVIVSMARDLVCSALDLESPKTTLAQDKAQKLGELWGPVADKRGWNFNSAMGNYALEITALIGTVAIVQEVRKAYLVEVAARVSTEPINPPDPVPDATPA